jgi:transposase InsO family protein
MVVVEGMETTTRGFLMDKGQKTEVAIFRFGVIHDFVSGVELSRGDRERLLRDKCSRKWQIPFSQKTRLTRTTILRWARMYQEGHGKLEALYPRGRCDQGKSRAMDEETACALVGLRKALPKTPVPSLIEQMVRRHLVTPGVILSLTTVYRFLHREGLMNLAQNPVVDRRRFEAELPNDIWQSDAMHGPKVKFDQTQRKTYLFAFLDDHSRLIAHAQFYGSETLDAYLDALKQALLKRGLPRKLYVDNAAVFRSKHLQHITASLGIALVHSSPYQPQGRGKVERFFRTVREQFLSGFRGKTLPELNETFELWLHDIYHHRSHTSTGQSPLERFSAKMECLRTAPKDLQDHFRKAARRRVAKDRTVSLNGRLYEAPVALIGKQIEILYHEQDPQRVEVFLNHQSQGMLRLVDLHINCRVKRDKAKGIELQPSEDNVKYEGGKLWGKDHE